MTKVKVIWQKINAAIGNKWPKRALIYGQYHSRMQWNSGHQTIGWAILEHPIKILIIWLTK